MKTMMQIYVAISLEHRPQKIIQKKMKKIPPLLIQDVREVSWQYMPTWTMFSQQQKQLIQNFIMDR